MVWHAAWRLVYYKHVSTTHLERRVGQVEAAQLGEAAQRGQPARRHGAAHRQHQLAQRLAPRQRLYGGVAAGSQGAWRAGFGGGRRKQARESSCGQTRQAATPAPPPPQPRPRLQPPPRPHLRLEQKVASTRRSAGQASCRPVSWPQPRRSRARSAGQSAAMAARRGQVPRLMPAMARLRSWMASRARHSSSARSRSAGQSSCTRSSRVQQLSDRLSSACGWAGGWGQARQAGWLAEQASGGQGGRSSRALRAPAPSPSTPNQPHLAGQHRQAQPVAVGELEGAQLRAAGRQLLRAVRRHAARPRPQALPHAVRERAAL